jgi:hypothetical protein
MEFERTRGGNSVSLELRDGKSRPVIRIEGPSYYRSGSTSAVILPDWENAIALTSNLPYVELLMTNADFNESEAERVVKCVAAMKNAKYIELQACTFPDRVMIALIGCLRPDGGCDLIIQDAIVSDAVAREIARRSNLLVYLALNQVILRDAGLEALADGLASASNLTKLRICVDTDTMATDKGAIALAGVLRRLDHLSELHLTGTWNSDEGAVALMRSLPYCTKLRGLVFLGTGKISTVRDAAILALSAVLPACSNLRYAGVSISRVSDGSLRVLAGAYSACSRRLTLNVLPEAEWSDLLGREDALDLIEGPAAAARSAVDQHHYRRFAELNSDAEWAARRADATEDVLSETAKTVLAIDYDAMQAAAEPPRRRRRAEAEGAYPLELELAVRMAQADLEAAHGRILDARISIAVNAREVGATREALNAAAAALTRVAESREKSLIAEYEEISLAERQELERISSGVHEAPPTAPASSAYFEDPQRRLSGLGWFFGIGE